MIVVANSAVPTLLRLFTTIENRHGDCEFRVVNPQYIGFPDSDDRVDDRLVASSGEASYALSSREIVDMLREGLLGFDWTDVAVVEKSDGVRKARTLVYVQCIDAGSVYVMTDEKDIVEQLLSDGFAHYHSLSLPYAMHRFADLETGSA